MPPVEELGFSVERGAEESTIRIVLGITAGIVEAVVQGVFVIVLSLYWSFDRVYFERLWLSLLAVELRQPARTVWRTIEAEAGAYLHSEAVQCLAAGVMLWIGYAAMGHPYPVFLAVLGALAWLFPWIGGVLAVAFVVVFSLPAILLDGASAWTTALPAALYAFFVLTFLEFVIEPRLFNRRRYNALLLVLVAVCLVEMIGVLGLLLGPPLAAAIQVLAEQLMLWRPPEEVQVSHPHLTMRERLQRLKVLLEEPGESRPDLVNLVDRLDVLINKTEVAAANGALHAPGAETPEAPAAR
jgi:predicted PurR-regulated permease PerM